MSSPVGHTLVGIGVASVVAEVSGTPITPPLLIGVVVASNLPDFDWIGVMAGLPLYIAHRSATHSMLVLGSVSLVVGSVWGLMPGGLELGLGVALCTALFSHLLVDLLTTSPGAVRAGFGIPLLWPLSSRRWALQPPILATANLNGIRSVKVLWKAVLPEFYVFGPVLVGAVFLSYLLPLEKSGFPNIMSFSMAFPRFLGF